jgi:hypothetical protein
MVVNGRYLEDVTIPDDTPVLAGTTFTKTWRVENNGDVAWGIGFHLVFVNGTAMTTVTRVPLPACQPGKSVQVSVPMIAPTRAGKYFSDWMFQDSQGNLFGQGVNARIVAKAAQGSGGNNNSYFVADVTIPDDTEIAGGKTFVKTWRMRNTGTYPWDGYTLRYIRGTLKGSTTSIPVPYTPAGGESDISVEFKAPKKAGTYDSVWKLQSAKHQLFGAMLWMRIIVPEKVAVAGQAGQAGAAGASGASGRTVVVVTTLPAPQVTAPHYSQRDARWGNRNLANITSAPSISRWGCLMTCFAMTATTFGNAVTPLELNELMIQRGGFVNGHYTRWDALQAVYSSIAFEGKIDGGSSLISPVDAALQQLRPVTVLVDNTPKTAYSDMDQHWVLVVGKYGEDYLIHDPIDTAAGHISLLKRYGRSQGGLLNAVHSAIFYRKR